MPITPSDIQTLVLKEDDFGHEMRVGKIIRDVPNIRVEHGGTYTDPVSGKPRQFDFRCAVLKESAELHLAVECKNLDSSAPIVMCGANRQNNEAVHDLIESRLNSVSPGKQKHVIFVDGMSSTTFRASQDDAFYSPKSFVGKSILRIKPNPNRSQLASAPFVSDSDADIYDKWSQALSSSVELAELACGAAGRHHVPKFYTAILPVVVVPDDSLWTVYYEDSGVLLKQPQPASTCELFVGREITVTRDWMPHQFTFSHIHFFTLAGFRVFLTSLTSDDVTWGKLFTAKALEIC